MVFAFQDLQRVSVNEMAHLTQEARRLQGHSEEHPGGNRNFLFYPGFQKMCEAELAKTAKAARAKGVDPTSVPTESGLKRVANKIFSHLKPKKDPTPSQPVVSSHNNNQRAHVFEILPRIPSANNNQPMPVFERVPRIPFPSSKTDECRVVVSVGDRPGSLVFSAQSKPKGRAAVFTRWAEDLSRIYIQRSETGASSPAVVIRIKEITPEGQEEALKQALLAAGFTVQTKDPVFIAFLPKASKGEETGERGRPSERSVPGGGHGGGRSPSPPSDDSDESESSGSEERSKNGKAEVKESRSSGAPSPWFWEDVWGDEETNTVVETSPNCIKTSYGKVFQSSSTIALEARSQVEQGAWLYRGGKLGRSAGPEGQFWSLENPLNPGYAEKYGIPVKNTAFDFVEVAVLKPGAIFITREAPGTGNNSGGGIEVVVNAGEPKLQYFHMPWEPKYDSVEQRFIPKY